MLGEPEIIINGVRLNEAQAMTVRVAVSNFNPECGKDAHGRAIERAYKDRLNELARIMTRHEHNKKGPGS